MRKLFFFIALILSLQIIFACSKDYPILEDAEEIENVFDFGNTITVDSTKQDSTTNKSTDSTKIQNDSLNQETNKMDSTETINQLDTTRKIITLVVHKFMDAAEGSNMEQGASCYGDYLFQFQTSQVGVYIYNLKEKTFVQHIKMNSIANNHCTNASFSNIFYEPTDKFPLLYVSGSNMKDWNRVQVYRITHNDSFQLSLVQEIILPNSNENNMLYWQNVIMDNDNNYMYIYANSTDYSHAQIAQLNIPDYKTSKISLTEDDIIERFQIEQFTYQQGAVIKNGLLYITEGIPERIKINNLRIIDLKNKRQIYKLDLLSSGFTAETEGLTFYNNELLVTTYGRRGIYSIKYRVKSKEIPN